MTKLDEWVSPKKEFQLLEESSFTASTQASDDWQVFPSWQETILVSAVIRESPVSRRSSLGSNVHSVNSSGTRQRPPRPVGSPHTLNSKRHSSPSRTSRHVPESASPRMRPKEKLTPSSSPRSTHSCRTASPSRKNRPSTESSSPRVTVSQRQSKEKQTSRRSSIATLAKNDVKDDYSTNPFFDTKETRRSPSVRPASNKRKEEMDLVKDKPRRNIETVDSLRKSVQQTTQEKASREASKDRRDSTRVSRIDGATRFAEMSASKQTLNNHRMHQSVSSQRRRESVASRTSSSPRRTRTTRSSSRAQSPSKTRPRGPSSHTPPESSLYHKRSTHSSTSPTRLSGRRLSMGLQTTMTSPVCKLVVRQRPHPNSHRNGSMEYVEQTAQKAQSPGSTSTSRRRFSVM